MADEPKYYVNINPTITQSVADALSPRLIQLVFGMAEFLATKVDLNYLLIITLSNHENRQRVFLEWVDHWDENAKEIMSQYEDEFEVDSLDMKTPVEGEFFLIDDVDHQTLLYRSEY